MRHYKPVIFDEPLTEGTPPGALTISIIDDGLPFDPEHRCADSCYQEAAIDLRTPRQYDPLGPYRSWLFDAEIDEASRIACPECEAVTPLTTWDPDASVMCELCGDHGALRCPECGACFDHVWSPTFHVVVSDG